MNASMEASAVGNWDISVEALENILKREPENAVVILPFFLPPQIPNCLYTPALCFRLQMTLQLLI
jgi:hypothetical protein